MKALREAVEVGRRAQVLNEIEGGVESAPAPAPLPTSPPKPPPSRRPPRRRSPTARPTATANGNGHAPADTSWTPGLYEGKVRLEIGPLGDFSQLVGFEDAVGKLGATDISVERFSEGRATFSMRLDQPVDLLRELEALSFLDFKVRHTAPGQPDPRRRRGRPGSPRRVGPEALGKVPRPSRGCSSAGRAPRWQREVRGSSPLSSIPTPRRRVAFSPDRISDARSHGQRAPSSTAASTTRARRWSPGGPTVGGCCGVGSRSASRSR